LPQKGFGEYTEPEGVWAAAEGSWLEIPPRRTTIADRSRKGEVFDPEFLSELEGIVVDSGMAVSSTGQELRVDPSLQEALDAFGTAPGGGAALTEDAFVAMPPPLLAERCNGLIEACRRSPRPEAAKAVESFVVFFQALVPTLGEEPAREVKATFFRLAPTLLQMAWDDFGDRGRREEGRLALRQLETLLLEVASVRLAPAESDLLFRSLDQLATLIAGGEYALAKDLVATPLLGILRKNRVARSLFRLMEVEVAIQKYLQERLGYSTPQLRVPEDIAALTEFGPVHIFEEAGTGGRPRRFLQLQLPDIPILSDIVVHLEQEGGQEQRDLRLDGLGSAELDLPPGLYKIGLAYTPEEEGAD
jgi:hypothetical protein